VNFTATNKCKFHSLETVQCEFVGCGVKFHAACKNRWKSNNNIEIDQFSNFCCNHHEPYSTVIMNERKWQQESIANALAAAAPTPRRGKNRNNPFNLQRIRELTSLKANVTGQLMEDVSCILFKPSHATGWDAQSNSIMRVNLHVIQIKSK
jgi:hypothetical protein